MRQHETWTGAANPGDKTFGVGSVEGSVFTVSLTIKSNIWKAESTMDLYSISISNQFWRCTNFISYSYPEIFERQF